MLALNKILKKLRNWVSLTIKKICYNKKQTKSPTKINESKQTKSSIKSNESKNKQKYLLPTHVLDMELYTGTNIVLSKIRNVLYVTESDIQAHIADLKTR